jgi:hypothetical protein
VVARIQVALNPGRHKGMPPLKTRRQRYHQLSRKGNNKFPRLAPDRRPFTGRIHGMQGISA